jgi:hypothetical protein
MLLDKHQGTETIGESPQAAAGTSGRPRLVHTAQQGQLGAGCSQCIFKGAVVLAHGGIDVLKLR